MREIIARVGVAVCAAALASAPLLCAAEEMKPLPQGAVSMRGEIGRRLQLTIEGNLLKLDVERDFLAPLKAKKGDYVGVGILLDAASRLAAATGDERIKGLRDRVAKRLRESQDADGYIGYKPAAQRVWVMFDPDEVSQIMLGLVSHHRSTGDAASLSAARKLADFVIRTVRSNPARAAGGLADVIYWICLDQAILSVYEATGDRGYVDFCTKDRKLPAWTGPIVLGRWGRIEGHVYGHLAKCLAQLRLYRATGDPRLLEPTRRAMDFLTRRNGMAITGAVGETECWHDSQDGAWHLGETCATTYLLHVLDELLRLDRASVHGDLMERAIYNTLFAAQSPDGRRIRYYTAFDGPRSYWDNDIYCCPNNFRRAMALLPELIYYRVDGGVAVNLYTASTAEIPLKDGLAVKVRQETDYPRSGKVTLHVETPKPASFPLWLRIPAWCAKPGVAVNGQPVGQPNAPGRFLVLSREWKAGDRVELDLPMTWRWVKGRQAQAGRVALMRGPLVYCLNPDGHKELAGKDLRQLTVLPQTLQGPTDDDRVRPGGLKTRVNGWKHDLWANIGVSKPDLAVELTEFPDAGGQATYFRVPNPQDACLVDDELLAPERMK